MFFYISGISCTFYDTEKKGFLKYFRSKVDRLLVPMVIAIFTLLVPRLYLSQSYEGWTQVDGKIEDNFFVYTIKVLPSIHEKLSWLWFLIVLFQVLLINYPLLAWSHRRVQKLPYTRKDALIIFWLIMGLTLWMIPCATIVEKEYAFKYLIPSIYVLAAFYFFMFILQILIQKSAYADKIAFYSKLAGPLFCILMNYFKIGQWEKTMYGFFMGSHYFCIFMA